MLNNLTTNEEIPPPEWFRFIDNSDIPIALKPTEYCHDCGSRLSGPYRITHRARVLTLQGFIEGVET